MNEHLIILKEKQHKKFKNPKLLKKKKKKTSEERNE